MLQLLILYQIMIRVASLPNWCYGLWKFCFVGAIINVIVECIKLGMKLKE